MLINNLKNYTKGWLVGNFSPSIVQTDQIEVAIKKYKKGDKEKSHKHIIATEYTIIVSGIVSMNGVTYKSGDVILVKPGEFTDFECLSSRTTTVVIKTPSVANDKFLLL
jgi:anti-sigma factor ChrR (cupin superfamily)